MSSGEGGAKETRAVASNQATTPVASTQQKKKRPRQRLRPRNKSQIANSKIGESQIKPTLTNDAVTPAILTEQLTIAATNSAPNNVTTPVTIAPTTEPNQITNNVPRQRAPQEKSPCKSINPKQPTSPIKVDTNAKTVKAAVTPNTRLQHSNNHITPNSSHNNHIRTTEPTQCALLMNPVGASAAPPGAAAGKTREEIMAEREAKKLAKQAKKAKPTTATSVASDVTLSSSAASGDTLPTVNNIALHQAPPTVTAVTVASSSASTVSNAAGAATASGKSREQIKAEREAKKQSKQALKSVKNAAVPALAEQLAAVTFATVPTAVPVPASAEEKKKHALSKAERRAIQEAQRAAKAQAIAQKTTTPAKVATDTAAPKKSTTTVTATARSPASKSNSGSPTKTAKTKDCKVKLFNHLESACQDVTLFVNNPHIHPSIARLGEQYAKRTVVGSNARCIAFLNALKLVIRDFETPPKKEFARSLETTITKCVDYLQKCRPLAVSVSNAYKHMKHVLTQLPTDQPESDLKVNLCRFIDTYIENQIGKAAEAISYSVQEKISNGDVILTFGCSSLINYIFEEAQRRRVDFRVIVVDSRPFCEGQELLRRLAAKEIPCSYVLINAVSFVMPEATKVLLGAHALLANGYVMARTGTAQVALVAHSFNVPVLVCCETHKFSERFQTDAIVYNELGNPDDLILSDKCCLANWQAKNKMSPLNLMYDITPPELVTAVVTEVSILPCTSVPVILRIKPTEIGYY